MRASQVVTAIREVEALVAEREVGDLLIAQGHRQAGPVVERGVDDLVNGEAALRVGHGHVADLAAPALDQRDAEEVRPRRPAVRPRAALGQLAKLLAEEGHRALDFQPAYVRARVHVARACGRDGDVHEPVHARRMRLAHVALQTGGARGQPDHAQLARDLGRDAARLFETRTHRGRGPEQLDCVLHVAVRGFEALGSLRGAVWRDVESRAARPQEAAVGRNPTSPASAPRSPTWFASRSSSSATARSAWPRAVARAPASASREWQYAVACPMVVSPASVST